jgi:hypothetical protein
VAPRLGTKVDVTQRRVEEFPWLEFDGSGPAAIAAAARRSIAAELRLRADQVKSRRLMISPQLAQH